MINGMMNKNQFNIIITTKLVPMFQISTKNNGHKVHYHYFKVIFVNATILLTYNDIVI